MNTIDMQYLLAAYGRAMLQNEQKTERIAELEEAMLRLHDEKALLIAARQDEVETVRMNRGVVELVPPDPNDPPQEMPQNVRIIKSRTPKGVNPALFIGSNNPPE